MELNSAAKLWTQFNCNITGEINAKIIYVNFAEIIYALGHNTLITKI